MDTQLSTLHLTATSDATTGGAAGLYRELDSLRAIASRHSERLDRLARDLNVVAARVGGGRGAGPKCPADVPPLPLTTVLHSSCTELGADGGDGGSGCGEDAASKAMGLVDGEGYQDVRLVEHFAALNAEVRAGHASLQAFAAEMEVTLSAHQARMSDLATRLPPEDVAASLASFTALAADHSKALAAQDARLRDLACETEETRAVHVCLQKLTQEHGATIIAHDTSIRDLATRLERQAAALAEHESGNHLQLETQVRDHKSALTAHDVGMRDLAARLERQAAAFAEHEGGSYAQLETEVRDHRSALAVQEASIRDLAARLGSLPPNESSSNACSDWAMQELEAKLSAVLAELGVKYEAGHSALVTRVAEQQVAMDRHQASIQELAHQLAIRSSGDEASVVTSLVLSGCASPGSGGCCAGGMSGMPGATLEALEARLTAVLAELGEEHRRGHGRLREELLELRSMLEEQRAGAGMLRAGLQALEKSRISLEADVRHCRSEADALAHGQEELRAAVAVQEQVAVRGPLADKLQAEALASLEKDVEEMRGLFLQSITCSEERHRGLVAALARLPYIYDGNESAVSVLSQGAEEPVVCIKDESVKLNPA